MATGKVFGVPLAQLVAHEEPKHPKVKGVPIFVLQAIRCINRGGIDLEGIFRISGNKDTVASLKDALDKGKDVDFVKEKSNPYDVASLLKQYLRELPEPVLTYELYDQWIEASGGDDKESQLKKIKGLIDSIPVVNRTLMGFLFPFFLRIAMNSSINKMDSGNISKTVGPNLLWKAGKGDSLEYLVNSSKINDVVAVLIDHCDRIFTDPIGEHVEWTIFDQKLFGHQKSIQCLAPGLQDKEIWSCDSNGAIRVWDIESHKVVKEMDSGQGRLFTMTKINKTQVWTASQKSAKIWDTESHACVREINGFAYCMARVGNTVWVGGEDKITVYQLEDFSVSREIPVPRNVVMALYPDAQGKYMWSATTDRKNFIFVWDTKTGEMVKAIDTGHKKKVNDFAMAGKQMWSAGDDNALCVWDSQNFSLLKRIEAHDGAIYGVTTFGDYVWSCGWDTNIKIWDTKTLSLVCELKDFHSDCVSSVQAAWHPGKNVWQAWTSSWDKSICTFLITEKHNMKTPSEIEASQNSENSNPVVDQSEANGVAVPPPIADGGNGNGTEEEEKLPSFEESGTTRAMKKSASQERAAKKNLEIQQKKNELEEKKRRLEQRKKELEDKKKELAKKKELTNDESHLKEQEDQHAQEEEQHAEEERKHQEEISDTDLPSES